MNPDIKAQWVTALRSGEYVQGVGALRSLTIHGDIGYCCLGVLCELAETADIVSRVEHAEDIWATYYTGTDEPGYGDKSVLPISVVRWAELDSTDPKLPQDLTNLGNNASLAWANDWGNLTFDQIADLIERHL